MSKSIVNILLIVLIGLSHMLGFSILSAAFFHMIIFTLSILSLICYFKNNKTVKINIPEIILIIFISYLLISNLTNSYFWGNTDLHIYLLLLIMYFALKIFATNKKLNLNYVFYGIITGAILEIIVALGQLFGFISNSDSKFIVGGLIGNPGALAGILSIIVPFMLVVILDYKKLFRSENFYYLIIFCFSFCIYLIISSDSRGAWIASFMGLSLALNYKYRLDKRFFAILKTRTLKASTITMSLLVITILFIGLYNYKQDSAYGRFFIWKTSSSMITEHLVFGNGFNSFANDYGKVQATYFLNNTPTEKETYVADYVLCAYNEFLELLIDSGIVGLILFLSIIYFALFKTSHNNNSTYYYGAKYSLVALLVQSMVSYPFDISVNVLMLMICLFVMFSTGDFKTFAIDRYSKVIISIWFLAICFFTYINAEYIYGMYYYKKGHKELIDNNVEHCIKNYNKAYKYLEPIGDFQFHYGAALHLNREFEKSIKHLEKATQLISSPNAFIMLGNSLKETNKYDEAENAYKIASAIIPSRLYPKYLLANMYTEINEQEKAIEIAQKILQTEEKVKTTAGKEIKHEMRELLGILKDN